MKKITIGILIFQAFSFSVYPQQSVKTTKDNGIISDPEYGDPAPPDYLPQIMPEFPGGIKAFEEYLGENLNYPNKESVEGIVIVGFMVEKDGHLSDIQVLRTLDSLCDEEALRLVKNMPPWIPGKKGNETVRVKMTLPIQFKLLKNQ